MSRNVIITGSKGNLGTAVTNKFVSEDYHIIGTVQPGQGGAASDDKISFHEVNLLDAPAVENWASEIVKKYQSIDALVCLVGGFGMSNIIDSNKEEIDKMINLNFYTAFNTIKSVLAKTGDQEQPVRIILIGAKPAMEKGGSQGVFPYALSKSMVMALANSINAESENLNASATIIVPSIIDTPQNRNAMPDANFEDWVTPESLAEKIFFVCSDQGKDLRDTTLKVYGNS